MAAIPNFFRDISTQAGTAPNSYRPIEKVNIFFSHFGEPVPVTLVLILTSGSASNLSLLRER